MTAGDDRDVSGHYAMFSLDGTVDGDLEMRCSECGYLTLWNWKEQHSLVDYIAVADSHIAEEHAD